MKKIIAIGMVKNSADIIESFIRCNGVWADKFVILDNMSTDRTVEILNLLKQEGYDIEIIPDEEIAYYQSEKMNVLLSYVCDTYDPDYIIPIDDDEVLTVDTGKDIKETICELEDGKVYNVVWRIYTPSDDDAPDVVCVPKRITHYFSCDIEGYIPNTKVIITKGAIKENPKLRIIQGNHSVADYNDEIVLNREIIVAHYPSRSDNQLKSKALVGWAGYMTMISKKQNWGFQWRVAYELAKSGKSFPMDLIKTYAEIYFTTDKETKVFEVIHPISLPDKCFEIRYTSPDEINYMENFCNTFEELAAKYVELAQKDLLD